MVSQGDPTRTPLIHVMYFVNFDIQLKALIQPVIFIRPKIDVQFYKLLATECLKF